MKKGVFWVLGLLCGIVLPLNTQAYEDGIYTGVDENGNEVKTVIFGGNDTFSGVQLTVKMTDQTGTGGGYDYYRGFDTPTTNSERLGYNTPGEGITTTETGYQYGNTYGAIRNNLWGGSGDTYENGFNPNPTNLEERQGPCDNGYHIPSRGERNALAIAWCNLNENCDPNANIKLPPRDADQNSGLIYIDSKNIGAVFKDEFSMSNDEFWSSSPNPNNNAGAWELYFSSDNTVDPANNGHRNTGLRVRCFKNSIVEPAPQTFTLTFLSGDVEVWSGVAISGSVYTGDVPGTVSVDPIPNITKDGYEFDGWFLEGESEAFDFSGTTITGNLELHAQWTATKYTITYLGIGDDYEPIATGYTIESDGITLIDPSKIGYTFTGRSGTDIQGITGSVTISKGSTGDRTYEASRIANEYTVKFIDGSGENADVIYTGDYDSPVNTQYPDWTKKGYTISWDKTIPANMPLSGDIITATWIVKLKPSGSSSGGGGRSNKTSDTQDYSTLSQNDKNTENVIQSETKGSEESSNTQMNSSDKSSEGQYNGEFQNAYEFVKENGITTMPTIQEANMEGPLTRIAMAKMLSYYAINILGQKPDETRINKFNDMTEELDKEYDNGVTLTYQLGIMGINMPDNIFRPDDEVTRGEFATALSRMIYKIADGDEIYYEPHMKKLKEEGIITNDDPYMKELRGYVMIMLMRSAK